jgi:ribosomal protein L37AE/L43A
MSKEIKLQCPLCRTKFITTKRNNIWCSVKCRDKYNKLKQQSFINPNLEYNLETDKFKIKGWIPTSN